MTNFLSMRRNPLDWQARELNIPLSSGNSTTVNAEVFGPWGVHREIGTSGWSITFVPLGLSLPNRNIIGTKIVAKAIVEEMLSQMPDLANAKVQKDISPHVEKIMSILRSPPRVKSGRTAAEPSPSREARRDELIVLLVEHGLRRAGLRSGQGNMEFYVPSILRVSRDEKGYTGSTGSSYAVAVGARDIALKFYRMTGGGEYWVTKASESQSKITNEKLLSWVELVLRGKSRVERREGL